MKHRYDHFCSCGRCKSDRAAQRALRFAVYEPTSGADIEVPPDPFESLKSAEAAERAKAKARP